jgi:hypothetical protein
LEQVRQSLMTASVRAAGAFSKSCSRIDRVRFPVPAYKTTSGLQSSFLRTAVLRARYRSCSNAGRQGRRSHEREALLASDPPFTRTIGVKAIPPWVSSISHLSWFIISGFPLSFLTLDRSQDASFMHFVMSHVEFSLLNIHN